MKTKKTQHRMFKNPVLEILSKTGPKMMIPFHAIIISSTIYYAYNILGHQFNFLTILALWLGGMVTWTLAEYCLHRFAFHQEGRCKVMQAVHYAVHTYHHDHPEDVNRLFMPPLPVIVILGLFFALFYVIMGNYAWYFLPGFEFAYVMYSVVHYTSHTRGTNSWFKKVCAHHMLHHYKSEDKAFGVSSTFWDRVFNTMP